MAISFYFRSTLLSIKCQVQSARFEQKRAPCIALETETAKTNSKNFEVLLLGLRIARAIYRLTRLQNI
jgi:hypothetical protein